MVTKPTYHKTDKIQKVNTSENMLRGNRTMTTGSSESGAITLPDMNVSGYVGQATIFN